jgi:hypothetical protein
MVHIVAGDGRIRRIVGEGDIAHTRRGSIPVERKSKEDGCVVRFRWKDECCAWKYRWKGVYCAWTHRSRGESFGTTSRWRDERTASLTWTGGDLVMSTVEVARTGVYSPFLAEAWNHPAFPVVAVKVVSSIFRPDFHCRDSRCTSYPENVVPCPTLLLSAVQEPGAGPQNSMSFPSRLPRHTGPYTRVRPNRQTHRPCTRSSSRSRHLR